VADLEAAFPRLTSTNHRQASPVDGKYNCIAFAADDTESWWWPTPQPIGGIYWPQGVPREVTLEAFKMAFEQLGYEECLTGEFEAGKEKIAIFSDREGNPTHAARQLASGEWASKLGTNVDIEHDTLEAVGGHERSGYGTVALYMIRDEPS
jgi:hypothetical protein